MTYYTIPPPSGLAHFVRCFWVLESDQPYTHHSMADTCPELIFHYRSRFNEYFTDGSSQSSFLSGIHGQAQSTRKFHVNKAFGIFGVYLYPQCIPWLFGVPSTALTNEMVDLNTLCGQKDGELEESMMMAVDNVQRVNIITTFLERKIGSKCLNQPPVFSAIQSIIKSKGLVKVKQLANESFLSERQFERQFKHFSGFNPKLFARIVRFQSAMADYDNKTKTLTEIAFSNGYYDQSHFIHEFKEFSGRQPREYFSGSSEAASWRE